MGAVSGQKTGMLQGHCKVEDADVMQYREMDAGDSILNWHGKKSKKWIFQAIHIKRMMHINQSHRTDFKGADRCLQNGV